MRERIIGGGGAIKGSMPIKEGLGDRLGVAGTVGGHEEEQSPAEKIIFSVNIQFTTNEITNFFTIEFTYTMELELTLNLDFLSQCL